MSAVRFDKLAAELAGLQYMFILSYLTKNKIPHLLKKVTKVSKVSKVLNKEPKARNKCLSEMQNLLQIYCGIVLILSSAERGFGVMKKIKTWLRNTVTDISFNI